MNKSKTTNHQAWNHYRATLGGGGGGGGRGETVIKTIHTLSTKIQQEKELLEGRVSKIDNRPHKRKVDPQGCKTNYKGISPKNTPGKSFTKMIRNRMKQYVERTLGEEQDRSRTGRCTLINYSQCNRYLQKA